MRRLVLGFAVLLTLLAVIGTATNFGWVPFLFLPTIGAILPLIPVQAGQVRIARVIAAALIGIFAVLGAASVGVFFVPGAIAMGFSAALAPPSTRSTAHQ